MKNDHNDQLPGESDLLLEEIGDYMSSPVLTVDSQASVQEAAQYMHASNVGCLLVQEFDNYIGILTESDLTRKVVSKGLNSESIQVSSIMSKPLHKLDRFLPVEEANEFMHKNKIRHIAVTEEDKVVGVLSVKDLVAYYAKSSFRMNE